MERIIEIETAKIKQHPDNPRKDVGDVTELADSMKKNGVMQNLTVCEDDNGYTVLIGHRRLVAAKLANIDKLPCKVVELDHKQQVALMLEENMQRVDLTPLEQAHGFQMMMDLGWTEQDIADKTGFSASTISRRLKIAKLEPNKIEELNQKCGFEIPIQDMITLTEITNERYKDEIFKASCYSIFRSSLLRYSEETKFDNCKEYFKRILRNGYKYISKEWYQLEDNYKQLRRYIVPEDKTEWNKLCIKIDRERSEYKTEVFLFRSEYASSGRTLAIEIYAERTKDEMNADGDGAKNDKEELSKAEKKKKTELCW